MKREDTTEQHSPWPLHTTSTQPLHPQVRPKITITAIITQILPSIAQLKRLTSIKLYHTLRRDLHHKTTLDGRRPHRHQALRSTQHHSHSQDNMTTCLRDGSLLLSRVSRNHIHMTNTTILPPAPRPSALHKDAPPPASLQTPHRVHAEPLHSHNGHCTSPQSILYPHLTTCHGHSLAPGSSSGC